MKNYRNLVSPLLLTVGTVLTISAHAAQNADSKEEAQQLTEDTSPQGQYKIAQKEAHAAYQQALSDCKKMSKSERAGCMKEAKSNYQSDLAAAKRNYSSGK